MPCGVAKPGRDVPGVAGCYTDGILGRKPRQLSRSREQEHGALPLRQRAIAGSAKAIALFALLTLALGSTCAASPEFFRVSDIVRILALGAALNSGAFLLALLPRAPWVANILLSTVAVFGVASSHAIHTDLIATPPLFWLLLGAAGFALFTAFGAIDRSPILGLTLICLVSTVTSLFAADHLFARDDPAAASVDMSHVRNVTFKRRPNVYFLSFDGMTPRVLLRKYMGLETTPFHDLFADRFRRFENFFVHASWTNYSLGSVLALKPMRRSASGANTETGLHLFSGHVESPLIRLFKFNGYEATTAYETDFFGKTKGPFIDHYWNGGAGALCGLLAPRVRAVSFWGYCPVFGQRRHIFDVRQEVIDRFGAVAFRNRPQFAMAHLWTPGHAFGFRYGDEDHLLRYRAAYLRGSLDAAWLLWRLLAHLDENDPQAILLVYGDHGPLLSAKSTFADSREFVVQDRFGVLGGVYPPSACEQEFDAAQERRAYLTVLDAVHAVLRCLSGGESPLRNIPSDYTLDGWPEIVPNGHLRTYADFLYE